MEKFKITIKPAGAVILTALARFSHLDTLLAYVLVDEFKNKHRDWKMEDIEKIIANDIPLQKIKFSDNEFLYVNSIPVCINEIPFSMLSFKTAQKIKEKDTSKWIKLKINIYKSSNSNRYLNYWPVEVIAKAKKYLDQERGPHCMRQIKYEPSLIEKIEYTGCGDVELVERIIKQLRYIYKKTAIGFGKIADIQVEKASDVQIQRLLPVEYFPDVVPMFYSRVLPPYWDKSKGVYLCGLGVVQC
ncbi:hypothetical protein [Thermodesulfovibrio yellowstonii]|uniref:hypothetical protein n=1 Tax=Thermodesulfovibrio yellowstonii TaxID=28262 RepID=UPI00041329FB|nr:hypothetical protein [Thermodesulfovibrio islandicus]